LDKFVSRVLSRQKNGTKLFFRGFIQIITGVARWYFFHTKISNVDIHIMEGLREEIFCYILLAEIPGVARDKK
jgi:hypothetical protein